VLWPRPGAMLGARHAAERLQNCWHGGPRTIEQLRQSMQVRSWPARWAHQGEALECIPASWLSIGANVICM
jgi:hypothetical protein